MKSRSFIAQIFFILVMSIGCSFASGQTDVKVVTAEELMNLKKNGAKVIDVRTLGEVNDGKIPGAVHVVLSTDFLKSMDEFSKDEDIIVYCKSGGRSTRAASLLKDAGFTSVFNYKGSFDDWSSKGLKTE